MTKKSVYVHRLVCAALCLALALVLPLLTGQIPQVGSMLCPMHIPIFLCGFICGWPWGLAVGFVAPLLRHALFSVPVMPMAVLMAVELATYGALTGFLAPRMPKGVGGTYIALIAAMLGGRMMWGLSSLCLASLGQTEFPLSAFVAGAFTQAVPGIILHLFLVPLIVMALKQAKLIWNE